MDTSRLRAAMRSACIPLVASMLAILALATGPMQTVHAATITVDSIDDVVHSADCAFDGHTSPCSLRDTIIFANAHPNTTISLPAGTYNLTIGRASGDDASTGDLNLTANMTIIGAGADTTIIDGSGMSPPGRIFYNSVGASGPTVSISGVTIRGGTAPGAGCPQANDCFDGGGIFNRGNVTLTDVWITGNTAGVVVGSVGVGGGVANRTVNAMLTLNRTTISGNTASATGCGVTGGPCGGGIYNQVGTVIATNSTISGNTGGGIVSQGANNSFASSTISANTGGHGLNSDGGRGGYALTNSIITDGCDTTVATDGLHNLDAGTSCGFADPSDRNNANPSLGPLRLNAPGHTPTHGLKSGSAALDKIPASANCPATDQRGVARPQPAAGLCDIGAYELTQPAATGFAVSGYPSSTIAGESHTVTVTAKDASNTTATTYSGVVRFSSSDAAASLPADSALTNGVGTFSVTFHTPGVQSITATDTEDGTITGTQSGITVTQTTSTLTITDLSPTTAAGDPRNFTVTAKDSFGATVTGYTGTVRFTSSDAAAALPADTTLTNGAGSFSVTFRTAGSQTFTATDAADGSVTVSQAISVTPNAATSFSIGDYPSPTTAGISHSFTVVAHDQSNNIATGYTGTVHFTGSDAQANLPDDYTFVVGDLGMHVFTAVFKTAGRQNITATDAADHTITGTQGMITVVAGPATQLVLSGPSSITAGAALSVTVTAKDAFNNTATGYTGKIHVTSTDGRAMLPADYTFVPGDSGGHSFSVTLKTAGSRSITATDTAIGTITGTQSGIIVNPAAAATLILTGFSSPSTAGTSGSVTVTAQDAFGNIATGYTGTVHLTSGDPQAAVPSDYIFVGTDNGTHTLTNAITLKTAGGQSITARDAATPAITGSQNGITIVAASAASLVVSGYPSQTTVNASNGFIVFAKDAFGNTAPSYAGTIRFTSSDGAATLPANYTFTGVDAGAHLFTAVMKTVGTQSLTATDTVTAPITGTQGGIGVTAGAATSIAVATGSNQSTTVHTALSTALAVTVTDITHNPVPNVIVTFVAPASGPSGTFAGDVHAANVPTNASGVATAPAFTANTAVGGYSVSASVSGVTTPATFSLTNTPGAAESFTVGGLPSTIQAGTPLNITVTAKDAFGNIATGYRGTVTFILSDTAGTKPPNYTFTAGDAGVHTFAGVVLDALGAQSLAATDTNALTVTASQPVQVSPGPAATLALTNFPSPVAAGSAAGFIVVVRDAFGNTASGYTGTLRFTATDSAAILPANYTFTGADQGVHSFIATLKTPGSHNLAATDISTGTLTGSQTGISVTTAPAIHLVVTAPANASAGAAIPVTVTAQDSLNNIVTGYTRTIRFASNDTQAALPGDYTFVTADNGVHTFTVMLKLAGSRTITITDLGDGTISGITTVIVSGPTIASVSPISGPPADGTTITLTGTNLQGASVTVGGTACAGMQVNGAGTSLTCVAPAHADGTVDITVTTSGGAATLAHAFTYVTPGSVEPPAARPGTGGSGGAGGGAPAAAPSGR